MPRITLTTDGPAEPQILFEEEIQPVHLSTGHAAAQFVERLAWALMDAEPEGARSGGRPLPARDTVREHSRVVASRSYMTVRG